MGTMGNYIGSFDKKNQERGNIRVCEKRYGYNLNDLHSYIYKINLPLKPAYINYILEDKKKDSDNDDKKETWEEENKNDVIEIENDKFIDLYKTYEKYNINDTKNIYKNTLIINKENNIKRIKDKYIHFFYDPNYKYDANKNNIYTEETISNYLIKQNKGKDVGENSNEHNNQTKNSINGINKTYTNLCLNYYNNLDTCVIKKYEKNVQNRKYKFSRLHTCKPHYVLFTRCIRYRDNKLMHTIKKMEWDYYKKLNDKNKSEYLNEFLTNINYHEYLISKLYDGVEKIKLKKELNELRKRYNHIIKENEIVNTTAKGIKSIEKKTTQDKKPILLSIQ